VVWGTDSIWFGSPQDQIQALRAFEISKELQEKYGYPALTPRIKAKIFAQNGARLYGVDLSTIVARRHTDELGRAKAAYLAQPAPSHLAYGPRTRRELFELLRSGRG
jgi:hypothetical protein